MRILEHEPGEESDGRIVRMVWKGKNDRGPDGGLAGRKVCEVGGGAVRQQDGASGGVLPSE